MKKKILDFPTIRQSTSYTCSCASVQACLCYYGFNCSEGKIRRLMRVEKDTREIHPRKIVRVIRKFGLDATYRKFTSGDIMEHIDKGIPVILDLQAWYISKNPDFSLDNDGHYVVAIGYDKVKRRIIFSDPACFYKTYLSFKELEERWHDGDKTDWDYDHMGIVVWGKRPSFRSNKIVRME